MEEQKKQNEESETSFQKLTEKDLLEIDSVIDGIYEQWQRERDSYENEILLLTSENQNLRLEAVKLKERKKVWICACICESAIIAGGMFLASALSK